MIKNIDRDGVWTKPATGQISFSNPAALGSSVIYNSEAAVFDMQASANAAESVALGADQQAAIGVHVVQPLGDNTPYRVKASAISMEGGRGGVLAVGYGPASPSGNGDTMTNPWFIPFAGDLNELVMVPPLPAGDPLEDRPLVFALVVVNSASAPGGGDIFANLSVQRLATKPPTIHRAVS